MKVYIKKFSVDMEVKNSGVEFSVYSPNEEDFLGDAIVTKTGIQWNRGRSQNGPKIKWEDFIAMMEKG